VVRITPHKHGGVPGISAAAAWESSAQQHRIGMATAKYRDNNRATQRGHRQHHQPPAINKK